MRITLAVALSVVSCLLVMGCSPTAKSNLNSHGHEDGDSHGHGPRVTYSVAVARITKHRDAIEAAFTGGSPEDCHEDLHEIGHLLTELPEIAADTDLPKLDLEQVHEASEILMKAFGKVDALMHGSKEGVAFEQITEEVDAAIDTLRAKQELTGESDSAPSAATNDGEPAFGDGHSHGDEDHP